MSRIIFDTETTGLPLPSAVPLLLQPHIFDFAAVKVDGNCKIIDSIEFLCNPGIPLEPIITKITGMTDAGLKDKPPFEDFVNVLDSFFSGATEIIAHNHEFDRRMLQFELLRLGFSNGFTNCHPHRVCTVESTFHLFNRRIKLTELYEEAIGKQLVQAHRAMADVMALLECVKWMDKKGIPL